MMNDEEKRRREKKTEGEYREDNRKTRAASEDKLNDKKPRERAKEKEMLQRSGAKGKQPFGEKARPASEIDNERGGPERRR